jgi:hypothetical protein
MGPFRIPHLADPLCQQRTRLNAKEGCLTPAIEAVMRTDKGSRSDLLEAEGAGDVVRQLVEVLSSANFAFPLGVSLWLVTFR